MIRSKHIVSLIEYSYILSCINLNTVDIEFQLPRGYGVCTEKGVRR